MKIFIVCSKKFYAKVDPIKIQLEEAGHQITLPNSYDDPDRENRLKSRNLNEHAAFKADMIKLQREKILANDAVLVLNYEKSGYPNYIGGATFLEVYEAFMNKRYIFFYNPLPQGMLYDELVGMSPTVINQDLNLIKELK